MMAAPARFILLVVAVVGAAAALVAPRGDEQLAVLRDEDKDAQIIALLEPRLALSENDPVLLATLGRSYAAVGDHRRAIELLERYATLRPEDGEGYAQLAELYRSVGDVKKRIVMLQRSLAVTPSVSRAVELAGLYRDQQRSAEALGVLSRFESEATVKNGALLPLAELRAESGDRQAAISLLMRPEILQSAEKPAVVLDERLLLAELLVAVGRSAEAVQIGTQWIQQWHEPWLANRLLQRIVLRAPVTDASELAAAVAALHPELRFFLVRQLTGIGAQPVARHLLATWFKANPAPAMNDIAGFVSMCREQNEPGIVWQAFGEVLRGAPSDPTAARFGAAIVAEFGLGALAPFWNSLLPSLVLHKPLLAAQLAFHEHDLVLTRELVEKVDLRALETSERRTWIDLLSAVGSPAEVFGVLQTWRSKDQLPPDLLTRYARVAGELGHDFEYRAALADLRRRPGS